MTHKYHRPKQAAECLVQLRDFERYFRKSGEKMTGRVKKINHEKGFGFITSEAGGEYFFHKSALKNCSLDELEVGREVTFEDSEGIKGPRAEDVYV